jgi:DNA processing protein
VSDYVSIKDKQFPALLRELDDAPERLYYRGEWRDELFERCLAVVGSRRMSEYGRRTTERLVFEVASRGVTVVSGFMYGVDAAAHKAAVVAGGRTVAVVAYGIKRACLGYMRGLYERILDNGGLVLSEYGEDEPPRKFMFPKRNRIIAGLCQATLVVEAGVGSGSLITAGYAKKYGRQVLAVPGPIDSKNSQGTLELIQRGAIMVRSVGDVLKCFEGLGELNNDVDKATDGGALSRGLLKLLREQPLTMEQMAEKTKSNAARLSQEITMLSLSGQIKEDNGRFYVDHS